MGILTLSEALLIINDDGTVYLDKGEYLPFICPQCGTPEAFDPEADVVICNKCGFIGSPEEFRDGEYTLTPIN